MKVSARKRWRMVTNLGARRIKDVRNKRVVISINTISFITLLLASTIGPLLYFLTAEKLILFPALIESFLFAVVIYLNYLERYTFSAVSFYVLQNLVVVYFAIIFGKSVDVNLMSIFLIGISFLIFKNRLLRLLSIGITIIGLILLELNLNYYPFVSSIIMEPDRKMITREIAYAVIISLDILAFYLYDKNYDHVLKALHLKSERIRQYSAQQERGNRAKSIFIREVSHEIGTPLNAILSIAELLMEKGRDFPEIKQQVEHLYAACTQVLGITGNVLDFSKIEEGKHYELQITPVNIKKEITEVVNICQYRANTKSVRLFLQIDDAFPDVLKSDKIKLIQICNNLISNAIKFTEKNSVVAIKVFCKGSYWLLSVEDQGKGIAQDKLGKIFDPFVSEKSDIAVGTGLGLPITKYFIELFGGTITVESEEGKGSCFTVRFPKKSCEEVNTILALKSPIAAEDKILKGKKVLLVEDEAMAQLYASIFLQRLEMKVITASDKNEAFRYIESSDFDIVLLDLNVPTNQESLDILKKLKECHQEDIPVIALSAEAFKVNGNANIDGVQDYLGKPYQNSVLKSILIKHLT